MLRVKVRLSQSTSCDIMIVVFEYIDVDCWEGLQGGRILDMIMAREIQFPVTSSRWHRTIVGCSSRETNRPLEE